MTKSVSYVLMGDTLNVYIYHALISRSLYWISVVIYIKPWKENNQTRTSQWPSLYISIFNKGRINLSIFFYIDVSFNNNMVYYSFQHHSMFQFQRYPFTRIWNPIIKPWRISAWNISSYQYRNSHKKDTTVSWWSYLYSGDPCMEIRSFILKGA